MINLFERVMKGFMEMKRNYITEALLWCVVIACGMYLYYMMFLVPILRSGGIDAGYWLEKLVAYVG